MRVEIENKETIEVYTQGKSFERILPKEVINKLLIRIFSLECAHSKGDIYSTPNDFRGGSMKLKDNWRIKVEEYDHHLIIKEIFEEI